MRDGVSSIYSKESRLRERQEGETGRRASHSERAQETVGRREMGREKNDCGSRMFIKGLMKDPHGCMGTCVVGLEPGKHISDIRGRPRIANGVPGTSFSCL